MTTFALYRLPDGTIVPVDDSAAKGAQIIDFTLADGSIVQVHRAAPRTFESVRRDDLRCADHVLYEYYGLEGDAVGYRLLCPIHDADYISALVDRLAMPELRP